MAREIPLTQGRVALVDDEDYERIAAHKWYSVTGPRGNVYALRTVRVSTNRRRPEWMHRFILGAEPGYEVDHINGDGLDNRRANLRPCTHQQNTANKRVPLPASGYRGVYKHHEKFKATIKCRGRIAHIGMFATAIDAARAWNAAALRHHGEFAVLNGV